MVANVACTDASRAEIVFGFERLLRTPPRAGPAAASVPQCGSRVASTLPRVHRFHTCHYAKFPEVMSTSGHVHVR